MRPTFSIASLLLGSLLIAPSAHAIHAYHNDRCSIASKNQGLVPFSLRSNYEWIEATPSGADQGGDASLTGAIVDADKPLGTDEEFQAAKTKITNVKTKKYDDGCWIGSEGSYDSVIVIKKVSPKAAALGVRVGQEIPVSCSTEDIDPDGSGC